MMYLCVEVMMDWCGGVDDVLVCGLDDGLVWWC